MDPMTIAALGSAGIGGLQQLFGGRGRQRYKPSKYEQMVIDQLMEEYKGELPGWLTSPYMREAHRLEQQETQYPGLRGTVSGIKERKVFGPMAEAGRAYKTNLMSIIGKLTRGTGEMETTQPKDFSSSLFDLGYALAMRKKKGEKGKGVVPGSFQKKLSLSQPDFSYLWED